MLIVDDERNLVEILKGMLGSPKVQVEVATNLKDAFKVFETDFFDVVIADIGLSGNQSQEGLELIRFLRGKSPKTHLIGMSGHGTEEIENKCYENGADFYFNKPLDLKILIRHLNKQGVAVEKLR